ncbi:MAG TPA: hypothetical protein VK206_00145 [Anaerolineales bacterium]|nr:hypothetical protein [Anaerolineales bacterium]
MLENSQIDSEQSTVHGAERENPAFIEGMDSTLRIQQPQIEIPNIVSSKPYDAMCKEAYQFRLANGGLFQFALEGGNRLTRFRLRVAFSVGDKPIVVFAYQMRLVSL